MATTSAGLGSSKTAPAGSTAWLSFESDLLGRLGAPVTPGNLAFLTAWANKEGGGGRNNPLNTTMPAPGSSPLSGNPAGVQNYPSLTEGVNATYATLTSDRRYNDVVGALRSGTANPSGHYTGLATWSGGGYNSLAGVNTTAFRGNAFGGGASSSSANSAACKFHFPTLSLGPVHAGGWCADQILGGLILVGGGLVMMAGLAVLVAATAKSQVTRQAALALAGPAGRVGGRVTPAGRAARTERRQAEQVRRTAPVAAERRREEAHTQRLSTNATAARQRQRQRAAAERRRRAIDEQRLRTESARTAAARTRMRERTGVYDAEGQPVRRSTRRPTPSRPLPDKPPF